MTPHIDFRNLRIHRNSLNDGFEELTRQLVLADPPVGYSSIENRGPGSDGGVEILVRFPDGRVWGWQSKFFDNRFGSPEVGQLRSSFTAALANYTKLERYTVAIPRNLSGSDEGDQDTQRRKWREFVKWAETKALKAGRVVKIELWDDSYFVKRLQSNDPVYVGMRSYWFDQDVLTEGWFRDRFSDSRVSIGNRYVAEDHVDLKFRSVFDVLTLNDRALERISEVTKALENGLAKLQELNARAVEPVSSSARLAIDELRPIQDALGKLPELPLSDFKAVTPFLERLRQSRRNGVLTKLLDASYGIVDGAVGQEPSPEQVMRREVRATLAQLDIAVEMFTRVEVLLFESQCLLVLGEAGSGKSHLLADEVNKHLQEGKPALFIPARALEHVSQPGQSILRYLDLADWKFDNWLGCLSAAAKASQSQALIALDAINESLGASDWESALPLLMNQLSRFPDVRLVVSCRTVYYKQCVRDSLALPTVTHPGFGGSLSVAAKTFLDKYNVDRSSAPIFELSSLLNNPLFLTTVVRGLSRDGQRIFPRELNSLPKLLKYWITSVEKSLAASKFNRIALGDGKIERIVRALASAMADQKSEMLDFEEASAIGENIIGLAAPHTANDRVLTRLIDEGLLLDFPSDKAPSGKTVSFSFQRFSDYFVASAILDESSSKDDLATMLAPGGRYEHVFDAERWDMEGVRIALLALCPGRLHEEVPFLRTDFGTEISILISDFLASIPLREHDAVSEQTISLLEEMRHPDANGEIKVDDTEWYDLLIKLATTPDSKLNCDYLKRDLEAASLALRDATWSYYLIGQLDDEVDQESASAVEQLVDWAWNAPRQVIDSSQVRLASITLALMTSTMDRSLRDRVSKALASLLIKYPAAIPILIDELCDWDDSYVRERVLAASLAGVLRTDDVALKERVAKAVDAMVFSRTPVERHARLRRYAELIVKHVSSYSQRIATQLLKKATPPYASKSIDRWPTASEIAGYRDTASAIVSSVVGYYSEPLDGRPPSMPGDFGNYTMSGVDDFFSADRREGSTIKSREQVVQDLFEEINAFSTEAAVALGRLLSIRTAEEAASAASLADLISRRPLDVAKRTRSPAPATNLYEQRQQLETELLNVLPDAIVGRYEDLRPMQKFRQKAPPRFSLLKAQCWVVERCIELGWSQIHRSIEKKAPKYTHGRHDHRVERIGKKYQHIAYQELIGYLADYHWFIDYNDSASILSVLEDFERPDIDVTFLAGTFSRPSTGYDPGGLVRPKLSFPPAQTLAANTAWAKTSKDLPDVWPLLCQRGEDGHEWCIANASGRSDDYMRVFNSAGPMRNAQLSIELILVPTEDITSLDALDQRALQENQHDVFSYNESSATLLGLRSSAALPNEPLQFLTPFAIGTARYGRIFEKYSPKYGDYDLSGVTDESGFLTPVASICQQLGLRPDDPFSRVFVGDNGSPAFVDDPHYTEGWCLVRRDALERFAESRGLRLVWRVWFEKDGGLGNGDRPKSPGTFVRKDYLGYFYQVDGNWQGKLVPFRQ